MRQPIASGLAVLVCGLVTLTATASAATSLTTSTVGRVTTVGSASTVTTSGTSLGVGDSSNNTQVFASIFNFTINASTAEIAAATQITFTISATSRQAPARMSGWWRLIRTTTPFKAAMPRLPAR